MRLVDALSVCLQVSSSLPATSHFSVDLKAQAHCSAKASFTTFTGIDSDLVHAIMLIVVCYFAQGDEALHCNVGLSGRAFTTSTGAATSFYGAVLHSLSLHARIAPDPNSPGAFSRVNRPRRPSNGCDEVDNSCLNSIETPQFEAMGRWLLSVAQDLLDPELCWTAEPLGMAAGGKGVDGTGLSYWRTRSGGRRTRMSPRHRFEFLAEQVL